MVAAALVLALPIGAAAQGEAVVPPENSAVNQYTEGFPTAGGEKDAHDHRGGRRNPDKALGTRKAEQLNRQGPDGRAVAELTAETMPAGTAPAATGGEDGDEAAAGAGSKGNGPGGGPAAQNKTSDSAQPAGPAFDPAEVDGSSGASAVVGGALGASSGGMGILLPLLLLATAAWAVAYAMRQRHIGSAKP